MQVFIFSSLVAGTIVILLLFFRRKLKTNNWLLASSLLCVWYCLFINNLNASGDILKYPFLIRTGNITAYLIYPFLYLYFRNTFYPGLKGNWYYWLIYLPAFFYVIDMLPFYFAPSAFKIEVMAKNLANPKLMFTVSEGWLAPIGFHFIFRYLWSLFFFILQIRLLYRNRNYDNNIALQQNKPVYLFLLTLTVLFTPLIIPGIFGVIFHLNWYTLSFMNMSMATTLLALAAYMLISPSVLYGFYPAVSLIPQQHPNNAPANELVPGNIPTIKLVHTNTDSYEPQGKLNERTKVNIALETQLHEIDQNMSSPEVFVKQETVADSVPEAIQDIQQHNPKIIPPEAIARMVETIRDFILTKQPYKKAGYTIHDLSKAISIPVYQLSPIINQHFATHFNNWLNVYRVDYFIELFSRPENQQLTFEAVAQKAGFSSRATFISAFKKEKGCTPGIYFKKEPA